MLSDVGYWMADACFYLNPAHQKMIVGETKSIRFRLNTLNVVLFLIWIDQRKVKRWGILCTGELTSRTSNDWSLFISISMCPGAGTSEWAIRPCLSLMRAICNAETVWARVEFVEWKHFHSIGPNSQLSTFYSSAVCINNVDVDGEWNPQRIFHFSWNRTVLSFLRLWFVCFWNVKAIFVLPASDGVAGHSRFLIHWEIYGKIEREKTGKMCMDMDKDGNVKRWRVVLVAD